MSIWRLIVREIVHRRVSFLLSALAVAAAAACIVGSTGMLRLFDTRTEALLSVKEHALRIQTDSLQEAYRRIGAGMGFNILILPGDQNLADLYANDYASRFMPEWYVDSLVRSRIITVQHILPILQQKVKWPERQRTIILIGTRGEVPLAFDSALKKPLLDLVPPGRIVLGYELHTSLKLKEGQKVRFRGREFQVGACYTERGNKDDITAWINLAEAQAMLDKKGLLNGIMALECNCAMANVGMIREEIAKILPRTQVIEFASQALARAEARRKAADYASAALAAEKAHRQRLRGQRERLLSVLSSVIMLAGALCAGFLAFVNVRDRRFEAGILRAVGLRTPAVLGLFVGRSLMAGIAGAVAGVVIGLAAVVAGAAGRGMSGGFAVFIDGAAVAGVLIGAPLLSAVACWIPALLAVQQDPAEILTRE